MQEKFFTTGDVAKILKATNQTIRNWIKQGKLIPDIISGTGRFYFSNEQIAKLQNDQNAKSQNKNAKSQNDQSVTPTEDTPDYSYLSIQALNNIEKFDYHKTRGLTNETMRRFGCGYLPPGTKAGNTLLKYWWWMYFPTGKNGRCGNCRFIKEKDFRNFGGKDLFNVQALSKGIVFIVESEICAMSMYQEADVDVVGLSGTGNVKKVFEAIENLSKKPQVVIVMTDNDGNDGSDEKKASKGKLAALELITGLNKLGVFAFNAVNFLDDCKDPNEYFLTHGSKAFKEMIIKAMSAAVLKQGEEEIASWNEPPSESAQIESETTETSLISISVDAEDRIIRLPKLDLELVCPYDYSIDSFYGVQRHHLNQEKQKTEQISYSPIIISKIIENVDDHIHKRELSCYNHYKDQWIRIVDDNANIFNTRNIVSLASKGLDVSSLTAKGLVEYLQKFEFANAKRIPRVKTVNFNGWRSEEFIIPNADCSYELDAEAKVALIDKFQTSGSRETLIELIKKVKKNEIANTVIGAALAAPLVLPFQCRNIAIHVAALTESGKSAISQLAYSLFYNPHFHIPTFNATRVGLELIFANTRDLPIFIEDLNSGDAKQRKQAEMLPYNFVNPVGRLRGNPKLKTPRPLDLRGSLITNGEQFMTTETSNGGAKTRQIELNGGKKILTDELSREIYKITADNYGLFLYDWIETIRILKAEMKAKYLEINYDLFQLMYQGKIPTHIDSMAAIAVANAYFDVKFLDMTLDEALKKEVPCAAHILKTLPDRNKIADFMRAKPLIRDWILSHPKDFIQAGEFEDSNGEGQLELKAAGYQENGVIRKNYVAILPSIFENFMIEQGFSQLTINQLADDGFIIRNGRNLTTPIHNYPSRGKTSRMYKISIKGIYEEIEN